MTEKYDYKSFGKITSEGGFNEKHLDVFEVRYMYPTDKYSPKLSLKLSSVDASGKQFEFKSFRIDCKELKDTTIIRSLIKNVSQALGYVYGKQKMSAMKEPKFYEKQDNISQMLTIVANGLAKDVMRRFEEGFREAAGEW